MKRFLCAIVAVMLVFTLSSCGLTDVFSGNIIKPDNLANEEAISDFFADKDPIDNISVKIKFNSKNETRNETEKNTESINWKGEAVLKNIKDGAISDGTSYALSLSGEKTAVVIKAKLDGNEKITEKTKENYTFKKLGSNVSATLKQTYEKKGGNESSKFQTEVSGGDKTNNFDIPTSSICDMTGFEILACGLVGLVGSSDSTEYVGSPLKVYIKDSKVVIVNSENTRRYMVTYTFNGSALKSIEYYHEEAFSSVKITVTVVDKVSIDV